MAYSEVNCTKLAVLFFSCTSFPLVFPRVLSLHFQSVQQSCKCKQKYLYTLYLYSCNPHRYCCITATALHFQIHLFYRQLDLKNTDSDHQQMLNIHDQIINQVDDQSTIEFYFYFWYWSPFNIKYLHANIIHMNDFNVLLLLKCDFWVLCATLTTVEISTDRHKTSKLNLSHYEAI